MNQFNMDLQIIYSTPVSSKSRITKDNKQKRFRCRFCHHSWINRKEASLHIQKCSLKNKDQLIRRQIISKKNQMEQQKQKNHQQQSQQMKMIQSLSQKINSMQSQMEKIKQLVPSLDKKIQFDNIQHIVNQIVQPQLIVDLLKSSLLPQVDHLIKVGFNLKDIIVISRKSLSERISNIEIISSFSNHKKNMQKLQKDIQKLYQNRNQKYKNQIKMAFLFFKKFSQRQLKIQTRIIQQLSQMSFFKRKIFFSLYEKLRLQYSDFFNFNALPKRLVRKQGGNNLKRTRVNVHLLFSDIRRLLSIGMFQLASDIWVGVCLGLRENEYRRIQFQRQTGQIAKIIKLTQKKNLNFITRIIPRSLANILKKHNIQYPISNQRFKEVRLYCLKAYGTFYSLRSTAISLILSRLAQQSELGRFHKSISTTQRYYLDLQIEQVIHGLFTLNGYDDDVQSNIEVYFQDNIAKFRDIVDVMINLDQNTYFLEQSQKDAISMSAIEEQELTLINKMRKAELQNGYQVSQVQFMSISQIFKNDNAIESNKTLQKMCKSEDLYLQIVEADSKDMTFEVVQDININGVQQARLIKTISSVNEDEIIMSYKTDQAKMPCQQFIHHINSFKKSDLSLLRTYVKCFYCSKRLLIDKCQQHFKIFCQIHGDFHSCSKENLIQVPKERKLVNTSQFCNKLKLNKIKLGNPNNIKQIIQKTGKRYMPRVVYSNNIPQFKISIPPGDNNLLDNIQYVEDNQHLLPLKIKETRFGYGVFATEDIQKNTLICTYVGEIKDGAHVNNMDDCLVDYGFIKHESKAYCLLLTCQTYANAGKFFNSSKHFNSKSKNLVLEKTVDNQNRVVFIMFSSKFIEKGSQIKWYYGQEYWRSSDIIPQTDQEKNLIQEQFSSQEQHNSSIQQLNMIQDQKIKQVKDCFVKGLMVEGLTRVIQSNPDQQIQVASIIKIINAKVCIQLIDNKIVGWQTQIQAPIFFKDQCSKAYLKAKNKYKIQALMYGMLVPSGCDAAYCLAYNLGKYFNSQQPLKYFVHKMNLAAKQIGMMNTNILQVTGLGQSTSTARDLLKLAKWMRQETRLHRFLCCQSYQIERKLKNTNQLIRKNIIGKTGFGFNDKSSFVGFHTKEPYEIAILGSIDKLVTFDKVITYLQKIKKQVF